jgi:hypothetical protein
MIDTVEFYPVEVIKPFMSLTVGDVLYMSSRTGNYELRNEAEDIGEKTYSYDKYEISLAPWIIDKYKDHFQIYVPRQKEDSIEEDKEPDLDVEVATKGDIEDVWEELKELKEKYQMLISGRDECRAEAGYGFQDGRA